MISRRKLLFITVLLAGCQQLVSPGIVCAQYVATVSSADQQTVKGWGCCPVWIDNFDIFAQPLSVEAGYSMGATIMRHSQIANVGDANGNISQPAADRLCRAIGITADHHLPYILSNWSPPACYKTIAVNGSVSNGIDVRLRIDKEQAFCDFVVRLMNYIGKTKGLPLPVAYSMQNEPTCGTPWQGCIYDSAQYKRVTKLLRTTLNSAGYQALQLLGPEDGGYFNGQGWNWSVGLLGGAGFPELNDTAYNHAIGAFASHSYDWSPSTPVANFNAWISGCDAWGKDRWQTEFCYIEDTVNPHAVGTARRFISDMAFVKNNYWFTWTVSSGNDTDVPDALCYGDGVSSTARKPAYYVLKKLFTSIPPGSRVRRMISTDNGLVTANAGKMDMVAFANDTGMVVVIVNPTKTARTTTINGMTGTSARIYQTAGTAVNTDMGLVGTPAVSGGSLAAINLPVNSVTIAITKGRATGVKVAPERLTGLTGIEIIVRNGRMQVMRKNNFPGRCTALLTTIAGQKVLSGGIDFMENVALKADGLTNGVYFLKLITGKEQLVQRIVLHQ